MSKERILILDFGGQYKELIASTVRSMGVYAEIRDGTMPAAKVRESAPVGIILTGGPNSVNETGSLKCDPALFALDIPILGICYGMQLMCHTLGGSVANGEVGEYGKTMVYPTGEQSALLSGGEFVALMSHRDVVDTPPAGFAVTAKTAGCIAAVENANAGLYGVQFHPETKHTQGGREMLGRFLFDICGAAGDYRLDELIQRQVEEVRETARDNRVLLALSGGVDSSVCAALLSKAIPNQLTCIFVDHGFMRKDEGDQVEAMFSGYDLNFIRVNAAQRFLAKIANVSDPETKRKLIGEEFIRVFEEESRKLGDISFLAQGTIYSDVVESGAEHGAVIKSHHNVGGLPEDVSFKQIIEPLNRLFKDEVRQVGKQLGLPEELVGRQPFPGPGLAIRVIGEVTCEKLEILRNADAILREELKVLSSRPSQYFAVLTDTQTVGVKGDSRTYDHVIALRAVDTDDFMTATFTPLPYEVLEKVASRIAAEIPNCSRVVYDISSKPPATIEWE